MPGSDFDVLLDGLSFTECPRWHGGRLHLSDFYTRRVLAVDLATREVEELATVPGQPSGLGWLPGGDMLVVSMRDRRVLRRAEDGSLSTHADLSGLAEVTGHLNDMVVDEQGRAYVGNFGFDLMAGAPIATTTLVRVDPDGATEVVADGLAFPNGMVITPDGGTLVVAETVGQRLTAFDVAADGGLGGGRTWASFAPERDSDDLGEVLAAPTLTPDGICLDAEGEADPPARRRHGRPARPGRRGRRAARGALPGHGRLRLHARGRRRPHARGLRGALLPRARAGRHARGDRRDDPRRGGARGPAVAAGCQEDVIGGVARPAPGGG